MDNIDEEQERKININLNTSSTQNVIKMPNIQNSESNTFSQNRRFKIRHVSLPKYRNQSRNKTSPHHNSKSPRKEMNSEITTQISKN